MGGIAGENVCSFAIRVFLLTIERELCQRRMGRRNPGVAAKRTGFRILNIRSIRR